MSLLDGVLTWTEQLVQSAGASGLAAVMAAEAVLPIPSEVVLPVVGTRVSAGGLTLAVAVLATTVGSVVGAASVYALARWGGTRWVTRLTRLLGISDERWARAEAWFARRGVLVVLLGRLVPGVRCVVPVAAGSLRMPLPRFLALTAVGSALWNGAWIGAGAWLTAHWHALVTATTATLGTVADGARPVMAATALLGAALVLLHHGRIRGVVPAPAARW
jgi:membrane protein DedA with SNARE-associated domain